MLLSSGAREQLSTQFSRFGAQDHSLFDAFMSAVRHALSTSITSLFVLGVVLMVAGLVVVLFLKEVPLRRTHTVAAPESAEEASSAPAPGVAEPLPASVDRGASP